MICDPEICFRALYSRDRRFDGKFYIGVRTTGIYCRPICPAPLAKRKNMVFFKSAASARAAGYRPCLRCFPEHSPVFIQQNDKREIIGRSMRLILNGTIDEIGVGGLSESLGISERHLRRIFVEQLGSSPKNVIRTRRLHIAKQLISDTTMPMTQIAFAAGFQSIRQFNEVIKTCFKRPPRELRRVFKVHENANQNQFDLKVYYRPPFAWREQLRFLEKRCSHGIESVKDGAYFRFVKYENEYGIIKVSNLPEKCYLQVSVPINLWSHVPAIMNRVRELFDLNADPSTIMDHLKSDQKLLRLIPELADVRLTGCWDPFELAIQAILGQQVSVSFACELFDRISQKWGVQLQGGHLGRVFPSPATISKQNVEVIGIPRARARTIETLALAMAQNKIKFDGTMSALEVQSKLTAISGIGKWTSDYIAIRALNEPNLFLSTDLGIKKAMSLLDSTINWTSKKIVFRASKWQPWLSYANFALWSCLDEKSTK